MPLSRSVIIIGKAEHLPVTPAVGFNEVALLVMGAALAKPFCISPLLLPPAHLPFFFLQSLPAGLPNSGVCIQRCLFSSGNYCFVVGFCVEDFSVPSLVSPHCNLKFFLSFCLISKCPCWTASLTDLSISLSSLLHCLFSTRSHHHNTVNAYSTEL